MVSERDRVLALIEYLEGLGIEVNYGKNKAQGKKGFFKVKSDKFRIDISKELSNSEALCVLVHEFSHYVHYINDNTLKSLDFVTNNMNDVLMEELISLTVDSIPKESVKPLFEMQEVLKKEINDLQKRNLSWFTQIELKTRQKTLRRINSRISRLNSYYNSKTELFARSMEKFVLEENKFKEKAPNLYPVYLKFVTQNSVVSKFLNLLLK